MTVETYGTADFYFRDDAQTFRPKRVYVFVEGEYGFIPLIISKSLEGKNKPIVEIMSHHQSVDAFNQMPNMMNPAWTLTQIDKNTAVLSITNWWPLTVDLHSNPEMWSHAYPLLRDIVIGLKAHGCEALSFFTIMNNHDPTDTAALKRLRAASHADFQKRLQVRSRLRPTVLPVAAPSSRSFPCSLRRGT